MLYKVSAVAGSGKTHTLGGIASAVNPKKGLYIAFNKSVADEARLKFPRNIECKTIHSLAYKHVISGTKQGIEELSIDSIKTNHKPHQKRSIIYGINTFLQSAELSLSYIDTIIEAPLAAIAKDYITKMVEQEIPASFNFIIKYFYLQLHSGAIEVDYDMILLDEAGDLSEVTIEIFKLLKAPRKVLVGDPHQNIYAFMNTVNGFEIFKDEGISLTLSQSFRVKDTIARDIQEFCHNYLSRSMDFKGIPIEDTTVKTRAFISRTNSGLIARMIELNRRGLKYSTLREPKDIFALPLALISVQTGRSPFRQEYKYLERDRNEFLADDSLRLRFQGKFHAYLREIHGDDENLISALRLLEQHSYATIFETYNLAKSQPKKRQDIILSTAHTSKGSTFDSVYIENDMNNLIQRIIEAGGPETEDQMIEFNLAYVAVTRCRIELLNAHFI